MQQENAIEVKNLSKVYDLHKRRSDRFIDIFSWKRKSTKNTLTALENINFNVKKGEVLGITGPNGSGKSTLLKILAGVTRPSEGSIKINGTVAPLLEVGTGFHPDLTGRENIYLNGTILGLKRRIVKNLYDSIVGFSELQEYIDTPIKFYSSGMQMRLAFSVAIHLDTNIIILDEVLAVGDSHFRNKCMERIQSLSASDKTVIVVSHNMDIINKLCSKIIRLQNGSIHKG